VRGRPSRQGARLTRAPQAHRPRLLDLEGTVYQAGRLIENAADAIAALEARGIRVGYATNTTSRPRATVARELAAMGWPSARASLHGAARRARGPGARGITRCSLLLRDSLRDDFEGVAFDDDAPQAVVLGDLGDEMTFARLNRAFRHVIGGAELVTLARNRYWRAADGLTLDVGAFAAALEFATGRPARLAGKPAPEYWAWALSELGVDAEHAAVVGDDIESDVAGAQRAGLAGILVRTGKFRRGAGRVRRAPRRDPRIHRGASRRSALIRSKAPWPSPRRKRPATTRRGSTRISTSSRAARRQAGRPRTRGVRTRSQRRGGEKRARAPAKPRDAARRARLALQGAGDAPAPGEPARRSWRCWGL
jgi:HAD superfamily hydrolase (TIGR01458 family)